MLPTDMWCPVAEAAGFVCLFQNHVQFRTTTAQKKPLAGETSHFPSWAPLLHPRLTSSSNDSNKTMGFFRELRSIFCWLPLCHTLTRIDFNQTKKVSMYNPILRNMYNPILRNFKQCDFVRSHTQLENLPANSMQLDMLHWSFLKWRSIKWFSVKNKKNNKKQQLSCLCSHFTFGVVSR